MAEIDQSRPEWQQLELLVAAIQRQLSPGATVIHNARLKGRQSETHRQVDVLVEQSIGPYSIRIVIDCKDYASPVDVKGVEEFHGLMVDVGANKGALVCPAGFTKAAKKRAKKLDIDLFSPADTDPHKWQVLLSLPTICDFRSTSISFAISSTTPMPMRIPERFYELTAQGHDGHSKGVIFEIASERWDNGEYPIEPGAHEKVPLLAEEGITIDNGYGIQIPVDLTVSMHVKRQRYFGHVPVTELHGLRDEQTGQVITNAFKVQLLDPIAVQNQWLKIGDDEEPPTPAGLMVQGLYCWGTK